MDSRPFKVHVDKYCSIIINCDCFIPLLVLALCHFIFEGSWATESLFGRKWKHSYSCYSSLVKLMTPLTTLIFDFHWVDYNSNSDSITSEYQPKDIDWGLATCILFMYMYMYMEMCHSYIIKLFLQYSTCILFNDFLLKIIILFRRTEIIEK